MPLVINIRHLEEKDLHFEGEIAAEELELAAGEDLVRLRQPVRYDLTVHQAGRNVLVSGRLEAGLDCECARCLKPFVFNLQVPEWVLHLPLEGEEKVDLKNDMVDLTPFLREDILLEFPQHPLCTEDCAGLPNRLNASKKTETPAPTPVAPAWAELNKLKF